MAVTKDFEPSFGRTVSEILSRFCWVFCCPPCPPCITRKIAFHPPKPPTYRILISLGGTPEMEILDETLKISSPFQMKGDVVLLHEKPNVCDTKLRRLVAMQWLHPRSAAKNNMLILHSHVNAADLGSIQFAMELLARRTGCDVISYDYCGYGGSDGTPSEDIILQNADTVMHYITQVLRRPSTSVVVYGQSIGSVPTWYLASKYDVAGVIQLSGLHSGWRTLCRKKQTSAPYGCCCLNPFNNANLVKNVSAPILLIHGTEDEVIQFSQALEMRRLCGNKAVEPLWAEGLGHMGIERTRGFYARITKFINEEIHKRVGTSTMSSSSITTDSSLEKRQSPELRASRQQQPPFQQQPPPSPQQQPPSSREEEPQEQPTQTRSPRPDVVEAGFFRKSSVKPSAPDAQSSKGTHFQTSEPASNARLQ
ncbi:abhydrolase domain-containing protein [Tropilaelaps mercedesae]|uniref:Protein ABHD13 n=1 Tax=Tropilaelaps mercedesae TaxID=418985 RepID=A0A1V9Y2Q5_9ACAR|nr:abhydrolase domain-containing protein [Tropilaelaps mercedesae]